MSSLQTAGPSASFLPFGIPSSDLPTYNDVLAQCSPKDSVFASTRRTSNPSPPISPSSSRFADVPDPIPCVSPGIQLAVALPEIFSSIVSRLANKEARRVHEETGRMEKRELKSKSKKPRRHSKLEKEALLHGAGAGPVQAED